MAYNYGQQYQQLPGHNSGPVTDSYGLKPLYTAETASIHSGYSGGSYRPVSYEPYQNLELERMETRDYQIKQRIRILRLVSRVFTFFLSGATMGAMIIVLIKFFETRNQYLTVDGEQRTAWADGTITWYTYIYSAISTISFILDSAIMISYCRSIKSANKAASVAGFWSGLLLVAHIAVWIASVAIYRYGKEPVDGKFKDLWGWTCSSAASEIQSQITNINFDKYCTVQVSSSIQ